MYKSHSSQTRDVKVKRGIWRFDLWDRIPKIQHLARVSVVTGVLRRVLRRGVIGAQKGLRRQEHALSQSTTLCVHPTTACSRPPLVRHLHICMGKQTEVTK